MAGLHTWGIDRQSSWHFSQEEAKAILDKTGGVAPLKNELYGKEWWELVSKKRYHQDAGRAGG